MTQAMWWDVTLSALISLLSMDMPEPSAIARARYSGKFDRCNLVNQLKIKTV